MLNAFENSTVLLTGHTGFKGSWLAAWLSQLGANVVGVSTELPTELSHFESAQLGTVVKDHRFDVRDRDQLAALMTDIRPDFVFHLAAQALVRPAYEEPLETISVNAMGTATVLDVLRHADWPTVAVLITSDKAYDNVEWIWGYREGDRLGGKDPYSASKGMAELAIRTYYASYFASTDSPVRLGITRAGNVIGGGDWARDRIVPDCMRSWSRNQQVEIRSPNATRPWQHVLEPLSGYLALAATLAADRSCHGEAYNFGPPAHENQSVRELIDEMGEHWQNASWLDVSAGHHSPEANLLKLNCDKALAELAWQPTLEFTETVAMTVEWYRRFYTTSPTSMADVTNQQIADYVKLAAERGRAWAQTT